MKTPAALTLLIVTLLPLTACKRLGLPRLGGGTLGGPSAVDANPLHLPAPDVAMQAKLQPVIQCINRTFKHYEEIQPAYHKRIAELTHPAPAPSISDIPVMPSFPVFFEFKIEPYEQNGEFATACAKGLDQTVSASPADPAIDQPAREAAQALRAIQQPGSQMDAYLSQKAYVNDSFAKGRALDATLSPLLDRLVDDSAQLRNAVGQQEDTLRQHRLDAIDKAEGHQPRVAHPGLAHPGSRAQYQHHPASSAPTSSMRSPPPPPPSRSRTPTTTPSPFSPSTPKPAVPTATTTSPSGSASTPAFQASSPPPTSFARISPTAV